MDAVGRVPRRFAAALTYETGNPAAMNGCRGASGPRSWSPASSTRSGCGRTQSERARLVRCRTDLEVQHARLGGWEQAAARGQVERRMTTSPAIVKRDPQLEALMRARPKALGIARLAHGWGRRAAERRPWSGP